VEYVRDLGQVELWEESLRRSLERRGRPRRSSVELQSLRPARDLTLADVIERSAHYSQLRRRAAERPAIPRPSAAIGGVSALALLAAATVPKLLGGAGATHEHSAAVAEAAATNPVVHASLAMSAAQATSRPAINRPSHLARPVVHHATPRDAIAAPTTHQPTHAQRTPTTTPQATIASVHGTVSHTSGGAGLTAATAHDVVKPGVAPARRAPTVPTPHSATTTHVTTTSHTSGGAQVKPVTTDKPTGVSTLPPVSSGEYVNPLARASVTPERIDQGVDYSGSGTLTALGAGRVIATSGGGWPGNFIEYRLTSGAYAGRYVYYAEGVSPVSGLHDGESVKPGQPIATMSGGIEIGWASGLGTQPLAQAPGQPSSRGVATAAGRSFSALIASLGGPPGRVAG
jgi:hypothetical protein